MSQPPTEGRNRRANRYTMPEMKAPVRREKGAQAEVKPIGRSQELLDKEEELRNRRAAPESGSRPARSTQSKRKKRKAKHTPLWLLISVVCLTCTAALVMLAAPQLFGVRYESMPNLAFVNGSVISLNQSAYDSYLSYREFMHTERIFPGVWIDGVDVGGLTREEAAQAVSASGSIPGGSFSWTVDVDGRQWVISSENVPLYRNVADMVELAYAQGRANTTALRGTGVTPFRERLNAAAALSRQPVSLTTTLTYDHQAVRAIVEEIAAAVDRAPVNASVASFDVSTKRFAFTEDEPGLSLDAEELYSALTSQLDQGVYEGTLYRSPVLMLADVTKSELMSRFGRVSSYTTSTTSNSNRNTNIELSAAAINGMMVPPGGTFSFNDATGQRTSAKGYKEATAISGGQSVPEVGGGVCQTSSTLFNAVARANLEIVKRSPHAWPSSYVAKGMDATVNWPGLDFKFKNNTEWPIYITASYAKRKVTVEIYGMTLGEGITIDLESKVVKTLNPPADTKYVQNTSLPAGTEKETVKSRTGYEVETYQVWYKNGVEFQRELLCKSTYRAYQRTVEYN